MTEIWDSTKILSWIHRWIFLSTLLIVKSYDWQSIDSAKRYTGICIVSQPWSGARVQSWSLGTKSSRSTDQRGLTWVEPPLCKNLWNWSWNFGTGKTYSGTPVDDHLSYATTPRRFQCSVLFLQAIRQLQYSNFKKSLLGSVSDDGAVSLWDTNTRRLMHSFTDMHCSSATGLAFSPLNEILLMSVGLDKRIVCYDVVGKT
jgi:WD40 repeat protein